MRWIGILGSAAVLISLLVLGASSASATVLCEVNENPCGGEGYDEGTAIEASLSTGSEAVLTAGFGTVKCTGSEIKSKVEKPGGEAGQVVSGNITTLSFSGCNCTVTTLKTGSLEVSYTSKGNGTATGKSSEVTATCSGVGCKFGTAATGTTLGTVTGGSPATLKAEAKLPWVSGDSSNFVCTLGSGTAAFNATYTVNAPKPLFVEEAMLVASIVARPVAGGAKVHIGAKNGEAEIELENTGEIAPLKLKSHSIDVNETQFQIVGGGTCVIPGGVLAPTGKCTVKVKLIVNPPATATYTVRYGLLNRRAELGLEAP